MSSPAPAVPPAPPPSIEREVRVYGHSTLFYFWPVWLVGFILCLITYFGDGRTAVLNKHAVYDKEKQQITLENQQAGKDLVLSAQYEQREGGKNMFYERMSPSSRMKHRSLNFTNSFAMRTRFRSDRSK